MRERRGEKLLQRLVLVVIGVMTLWWCVQIIPIVQRGYTFSQQFSVDEKWQVEIRDELWLSEAPIYRILVKSVTGDLIREFVFNSPPRPYGRFDCVQIEDGLTILVDKNLPIEILAAFDGRSSERVVSLDDRNEDKNAMIEAIREATGDRTYYFSR